MHPKPNNNIILIGMPAVGKSTVGVLLAKRLGLGFVDTDLLIQTGEGRRLYQIIADVGMADFCDLEASYVQQLNAQRAVIATGGSVVYRSQAMAYLSHLGSTIFLDIELADLKKRLVDLDRRGVVSAAGQSVDDLYNERRPLYLKYADSVSDCTSLQPKAVVDNLMSILGQVPLF